MTERDTDAWRQRLQEVLSENEIDPQKLRELARERAAKGNHLQQDESEEESASVPEDMRTLGHYELLSFLGRGGTGRVFKAKDTRDNSIVAIKVLSPQYLADEQRLLRFYVEAKAAASLEHPNLVKIREVGDINNYHYMVMDYVDGIELSELVEEKPLAPITASRIIMVIARTMDYVHRQGILHRDLKPSNIMIDTGGQLYITDFGVAKLQSGPSSVTTTGMLLGTPGYMPPEQVGGKSDSLGPTCDVYSLGAVLYELLTGVPPFQGDSPYDTLRKVINNPPRSPRAHQPNIPKALETICLKCLEKEPKHRYPSGEALAEDLNSFLNGQEIRMGGKVMLRQTLGTSSSPARLCDPELMERWGQILRWHALLWLTLCVSSHLLTLGGQENPTSLWWLWGGGLSLMLLVVFVLRAFGYGPLTGVERQSFGILLVVLGISGAFVVLHSLLPTKMMLGLEWRHLIPFGLLFAALLFACLVVVLDRSFWFLALMFLALPFLFIFRPEHFWLILAIVLAVGFYIPSRRFSEV